MKKITGCLCDYQSTVCDRFALDEWEMRKTVYRISNQHSLEIHRSRLTMRMKFIYTTNSYSSLLAKVHYANHIVTSMPSHFFQPLSHTSPLLFNSNHNVPAQKNSTDRHHHTSQQRIGKSHPYAKGLQLPPRARNWTRFRVSEKSRPDAGQTNKCQIQSHKLTETNSENFWKNHLCMIKV